MSASLRHRWHLAVTLQRDCQQPQLARLYHLHAIAGCPLAKGVARQCCRHAEQGRRQHVLAEVGKPTS